MVYLVIYAVGVLIGLAVMRDPWRSRLPTALAWPLGPIAFFIVVPMMLVAATVVWPVPMLALFALVGGLVWFSI